MGRVFWKTERDALAFGVVPAFRKYELYQVRYLDCVPPIAELMKRSNRPLDILDIGAGFGESKRFVDHGSPGSAQWTAVEINPTKAEACRALGYQRVIDTLDLEKEPLPLPDASVDVVIASHVLEHLENAPEALRDWHRVLRPGGILLIGVPMHLGFVALLARLRYALFGRRPRAHCWFFSLRSLKQFLSEYVVKRVWGFRVVSARTQLPLEDWAWFAHWSRSFGARFPGLTTEVNVLIEKPQ